MNHRYRKKPRKKRSQVTFNAIPDSAQLTKLQSFSEIFKLKKVSEFLFVQRVKNLSLMKKSCR